MTQGPQRTITWIYVVGAALLLLITTFAIALAAQEHKDRVLSEEIAETASELQDTGEQIANMRDAEMKDMNDYIRAYSEMGPLLDTYDQELQRITDLYSDAQKREKSLLRIDRLYRKPHLTNWENMSQILDITHKLGKIMQQERSVIQNMAQLPESERMQFWHEHYLPLDAQEKGLRAKLLVVGQRMTPVEQ
ncbi:MAG TPA: hypothetical protein VHQ22_12070 [Terriglobales bacterium]|nr:hypothetical protein [Terriglobales bacterium]